MEFIPSIITASAKEAFVAFLDLPFDYSKEVIAAQVAVLAEVPQRVEPLRLPNGAFRAEICLLKASRFEISFRTANFFAGD